MDEIIQLKGVWKVYKEGEENQVIALKDITLSVRKGDFISIMGPSGSGKSTAMNLTGSLDTPTRGSIFLDKHNISHFRNRI